MYRHQELPDMGEQAPRNTGYGMYRHQELPDIECTGTKKDQRWMNRQREREKRDEQAPGNTGYGWTGTKKYQIWVYRHQPVAINGNWKWPHLSFFYSVSITPYFCISVLACNLRCGYPEVIFALQFLTAKTSHMCESKCWNRCLISV